MSLHKDDNYLGRNYHFGGYLVLRLDLSSISCFLTLVANDVCALLPLLGIYIYSPGVSGWTPRDDSQSTSMMLPFHYRTTVGNTTP
jgi:hypothetical protein